MSKNQNETVTDNTQTARVLNDYFNQIGDKLVKNIIKNEENQ